MPKAVFLDRDGTIIEDRGHLHDPAQVVFFPDAVEALSRLQREFLLFIVTNQPGIAEGILTRQEVESVNAHVFARLAEAGIPITDVYVCPHRRQDGCHCIKPNPYFLNKAAAQYQVDLGESFTIGDHPHDVELACKAGAQGIYVLTGHGVKHRPELPSDVVIVSGISAAATRITAMVDHSVCLGSPASREKETGKWTRR